MAISHLRNEIQIIERNASSDFANLAARHFEGDERFQFGAIGEVVGITD